MPQIDFFNFFRYVLEIVVCVYATVVTLQSLYGWYVYLAGQDKYISLVRRYLIVHGLRLRLKSFWGDVLVCIGLCVVLLLLVHALHLAERINPIMVRHVTGAAQPR